MEEKIKTMRDLLKIYPELKEPANKRPKPKGKQANRMRHNFCDFAQKYGFVISPAGYDYYIESFLMFNCCPCDPDRKNCPCSEAIEEVTQKGHCLCRLFWRSYEDYKKETFKEV